MSKKFTKKLQKSISTMVMITTIVWMSGIAMIAPIEMLDADERPSVVVEGITIYDGDLISSNAVNSDGTPTYASLDIYIAKVVSATETYKRLVLNPQVFDSYGHLNWGDVQEVDQTVMDAFTTSCLTREDGDTKVYAMAPNDDTGTKSWINLTESEFIGATTGTYSANTAGSIYTINSTDGGNYTATGDLDAVSAFETYLSDGTLPPVPGGGLTVALSGETPVSSIIPSSSTGAVFTKVNFTAAADGDATITDIKVKRSDVGVTTDLSAVYIYDGAVRLTNARTIASDTNTAEFNSMNVIVSAGTTKTLSIVANVASGVSGTHALGIDSASDIIATGSTVSGTFPIVGNSMNLSPTNVGGVTVAANGTLTNPTIGDVGATLAKFQLTASTEDSMLQSITLKQDGTLSTTLLDNFTLAQGINDVPVTVTVNGRYVTLELNTPMKLVNGAGKVFTLNGDISDSAEINKTVVFFIGNSADVLATSINYGFGVVPTITLYDAANDNGLTTTITTQGGNLTIANLTSSASDVKTNSTGVELMRVKLTATSDSMEVQKMTATLATTKATDTYDYGTYKDTNADATYDAGETILISNIKIKDVDTGATVGASKAITDATGLVDVDATLTFSYTDYFSIAKGTSRTLALVADINSNQISDVVYLTTLDFTSSNFTVKDSQDNTVSDIVPASVLSGANRTTKTSSLTVSRASSPESITVVRGGTADALGMIFAAGSGEGNDVKVSSVTLNTYVNADTTSNSVFALNTETEVVATPAQNLVQEVSLYVGGTKIAGPVSVDSNGNAIFSSSKIDGGYFTITAGTSKTVLVKAVTSGTAPYGSEEDAFAFTLASANISAEDDNGSVTATVAGTNVNGTTSPTVAIQITANGTITNAIDSSRPDAGLVLAGLASEQTVSKIKFTTTKEDFVIDKLTITVDTAGSYDNVETVQIYDAAGTALSATVQGLDSNGKAIFTGLDILVPKIGGTVVTVKAIIKAMSERTVATVGTAGVGADTGETLAFNVTTTASDFHAIGVSSGVVDSAAIAVTSETMTVRKTKPTVALATNGMTLSSNVMDLMKFTITADSNGDVQFAGVQPTMTLNNAGGSATLAITDETVFLYDITGTETVLNTALVGTDEFIVVASGKLVTISAGTTRTFVIRGTVTGSETGDSISTKITQDTVALSGGTVAGTETATGTGVNDATADAQNNFVWSDMSADTNALTSTEWTNSYLLTSWPQAQQISR